MADRENPGEEERDRERQRQMGEERGRGRAQSRLGVKGLARTWLHPGFAAVDSTLGSIKSLQGLGPHGAPAEGTERLSRGEALLCKALCQPCM